MSCSISIVIFIKFFLTCRANVSEVRMREEMAITLVKTFPKMKKPKLLKPTDRPWVIKLYQLKSYILVTTMHNLQIFHYSNQSHMCHKLS